MFLSIITINYNNSEGLKKTFESVASQTCRDFEHIIIDGASTDNSVDVIKEYVLSTAGKNVSYWISEPDSGVYNAMNKGIQKAQGNYCLFLNSGDWLFDKDTVQNEKDANHKEDFIIFDPLLVKESNIIETVKLPDYFSYMYFLSGHGLNHQNQLIKTNLLKKSPYNEKTKIFADNEFIISSIIKSGLTYKHYSRSITYYEASTGISCTQKELLDLEQKEALIRIFGKETYDEYQLYKEKFQLLQDYETGYCGILKKIRIALNWIASKTTRRNNR
ncbi:MAG: glycosyltransferase [Spirochaetaceae bacterium]|nr:glycosyltransferase [Spirochaetaceae bacterium]